MLVLYGSLRQGSHTLKLANETVRILSFGAQVKLFDPDGLPVFDASTSHPKVQELRELATWAEAHVWISPEIMATYQRLSKTRLIGFHSVMVQYGQPEVRLGCNANIWRFTIF